MWERYRRTFVRMQLFILAIAALVYFVTGGSVPAAMTFVFVMEGSSLIGASWAARLTGLRRRRADALPLRPVG